MSVSGLTLATRTALAAAITTGGLECRKYDTWDLDAGNIATLGLVRWQIAAQNDQSYGFGAIVLPVLVYQIVDGSVDQSLGYQEANVEKVLDGLAADRTLAGKVSWSEASDEISQSYYREPNGMAFAIATVDVVVTPFSNYAS